MNKKIISLILAMVMIISVFPLSTVQVSAASDLVDTCTDFSKTYTHSSNMLYGSSANIDDGFVNDSNKLDFNTSQIHKNVFGRINGSHGSATVEYQYNGAQSFNITVYGFRNWYWPEWDYSSIYPYYGIRIYCSNNGNAWREIPYNTTTNGVINDGNAVNNWWTIYNISNKNCLPSGTNRIRIEIGPTDINYHLYIGSVIIKDNYPTQEFIDDCTTFKNAISCDNLEILKNHPDLNNANVFGVLPSANPGIDNVDHAGSIVYEYPNSVASSFVITMYGLNENGQELYTPSWSFLRQETSTRFYGLKVYACSANSANEDDWTPVSFYTTSQGIINSFTKFKVISNKLPANTKYIKVKIFPSINYGLLYGGITINSTVEMSSNLPNITAAQESMLRRIVSKTQDLIMNNAQLPNGAISTYSRNIVHDTDVNPYFASFSCINLLDMPAYGNYTTHDNAQVVTDYIKWHLNHINIGVSSIDGFGRTVDGLVKRGKPEYQVKCPDGSIFDYVYFLNGNAPYSLENMTENLRYNIRYIENKYEIYYFDSTDSYAAVFLSLLRKYYTSPSVSAQTKAEIFSSKNKAKISKIIEVMGSTLDPETNLTSAFNGYNVEYLMDNCEVAKGYEDAAWITENIIQGPIAITLPTVAGATNNRVVAADLRRMNVIIKNAINDVLGKNCSRDPYYYPYVERGQSPKFFDGDKFYPNDAAQVFPAMFDILNIGDITDRTKAERIYNKFIQNFPKWTSFNFNDPLEEYAWVLIAKAAYQLGKKEDVLNYLGLFSNRYIENPNGYLTAMDASCAMVLATKLLQNSEGDTPQVTVKATFTSGSFKVNAQTSNDGIITAGIPFPIEIQTNNCDHVQIGIRKIKDVNGSIIKDPATSIISDSDTIWTSNIQPDPNGKVWYAKTIDDSGTYQFYVKGYGAYSSYDCDSNVITSTVQGTGNPSPSGTKFTYTTTDYLGRAVVYHYDAEPKTSKFLLNAVLADNPVYLAQRASSSEKPLDTLDRYYGRVGPAWIQILASMLKDVRVEYDNGRYTYADYMAISNNIRDMLKCSFDGYASLFQQYLADSPDDIGWEVMFRDINFRIVCSDESYANGNTADEIQMLIAAINGYVNLPILKAEQIYGLCMVAGSFISVVSNLSDLIHSSSISAESAEMSALSRQMQKLESATMQAEKNAIIDETSALIKGVAETVEHTQGFSKFFNISEAQSWGSNAYSAWKSELSLEEASSITAYTGDECYQNINAVLRGIESQYEGNNAQIVQRLSQALSKSSVPENVTLFRGTTKAMLGDFQNLPSEQLVGKVISDKAFMSTSLVPEGAFNGDLTLIIEAPKGAQGAYIGNISYYPGEAEVLLNKGQQMVVKEVLDAGTSNTKLIVELIP